MLGDVGSHLVFDAMISGEQVRMQLNEQRIDTTIPRFESMSGSMITQLCS